MAQTDREVSDEVAQDALRYGGKSRKVPTHSAMQAVEQDPDASATDAEEDDFYDDDAKDKGY